MRLRTLLHFVILTSVMTLATCGESTGPGPATPIEQLPRDLTADEELVIAQSTGFGLRLLAHVAADDPRPNIVLSPLSASMALGMTLNGAVDSTHSAMSGTLGWAGLDQERINQVYKDLIELLVTLDPTVEFNIANAIWANQQYTFDQAFFDRVRDAFGARVESSDFRQPATLDAINGWVNESTSGKIEKILDFLDPDQVMILLNAMFFDGAWTQRFDPGLTTRAPFHRPDGSDVTVDIMNTSEGQFGLGGIAGIRAAELPYGGGAFTLMVVLPDDGNVRNMVQSMDAARWEEVVASLFYQEVDGLSFPKLRLTYDTYLNEPLKAMGMDIAFHPAADFSGMSPDGHRFCIDFVRQKTFMEVDEAGTRAAAVTGVGIGTESFTGIIVDRPFLFAIRERLSGTVLFMGVVEDPSAGPEGPVEYVDTCM